MSKPSAVLREPTPTPAASACGAADTLLRAASECARQHERMGRALERGCSDLELQQVAELTSLADTHLQAMTATYEKFATAAPEAKDEAWWRAANALWHAGREYERRNAGANQLQRLSGKHSKEKLAELMMESELERSALMALKQAIAEYRAIRTDLD